MNKIPDITSEQRLRDVIADIERQLTWRYIMIHRVLPGAVLGALTGLAISWLVTHGI